MKTIKRTILLGIFFFIIIAMNSKVHAASASISANKTSAKVGDTIKISVTTNAAAWNVKVSGAVSKTIVGYSDDAENTKKTTTINFKPKSKGTYKVSISGDVSDGSTNKTKSVSGSVSIKVTEKNSSSTSDSKSDSDKDDKKTTTTTQKSTNANLSNLGITPTKYDFHNFKAATTSYTISVPNEAEKISIYATKANAKATLTGTGAKTLKEGRNVFYVKVTAEDKKTTKTYTLIINRKAAEEDKKEDDEEKKEDKEPEETKDEETNTVETPTKDEEETAGITKLSVSRYNISPSFEQDVYEYTLDLNDDVEQLDIKTETSSDDIEVEIVGNEDLVEGENVITILAKDTNANSTLTYQIIVNKNVTNIDVTALNTIITDAQNTLNKKRLIVKGTIAIIVLLIILYLIESYRVNKKKGFDITEENEETSELEDDELHLEEKIEERYNINSDKKGKRFK